MSVEPIIEVPRPVEADPPKERRPGGRTRAVALGGLAVAVLGGALGSGASAGRARLRRPAVRRASPRSPPGG
jgi:hypothetical protein